MSLRSSAYACALVAAMKLINKMVWMMCVRVYDKIGHGFFNQLQMMQSSSVELQTTVVNRNASRHSRWAGLPIEMHR